MDRAVACRARDLGSIPASSKWLFSLGSKLVGWNQTQNLHDLALPKHCREKILAMSSEPNSELAQGLGVKIPILNVKSCFVMPGRISALEKSRCRNDRRGPGSVGGLSHRPHQDPDSDGRSSEAPREASASPRHD